MSLFWGLILGLPAGFFLTLWFGRRSFPITLWGARFARLPNSFSFDPDDPCRELQQKTEDLAGKIALVDLELQNMQARMHKVESGLSALFHNGELPAGFFPPGPAAFSPGKNSLPTAGRPLKVLQCRQEIYRLYREGLPLSEIARQLKIRQGEVELVLSLKGYGG